jgi:transcriptional regulatory protein RtcR
MSGYVIIGTLGSILDKGQGSDRWTAWRPTVSLCQHEELLVHRLELLHDSKTESLAREVAEDIALVAPETKVNLHVVDFRDPWDFEDVYGGLHGFARSYSFDTDRERYLFHVTTGTHVVQICTFLLTESRHFPGQLIQTAPPRRRGKNATGRYAIIDLDRSKYDRIAERFATEQREAAAFLKAGIDTGNQSFNRMIDEIEHVAVHSDAPILLTGPTGAGKSSLARRIYDLKKLRHGIKGRFVEVNCATLRGDAAMSTLFGHTRGAFTGAVKARPGLLREADGGMLFLDEVGELGVDEQAMLLQAIEEKRFLPLGADSESRSEFQLICGTNSDLAPAVQGGTFRNDLLARINMWTFALPGLADRREDIEPNIHYELSRITTATGRNYRFNREALDAFLKFANASDTPWTGNFRDLSAAVARMATMTPAGRITEEIVRAEIVRLRHNWRMLHQSHESPEMNQLRELLADRFDDIDEFDRVQLAHVVTVCRHSTSLSAAGRQLFSASRKKRRSTNDADRLRKYLAKFDLDWPSLQIM